MPFYFTDDPSGLIPASRPVLEFNRLHLYPACRKTTRRALQMRHDVPLKGAVTRKPNEINDTLLFAELIEIGTGKSCIPAKPKVSGPGAIKRPRPMFTGARPGAARLFNSAFGLHLFPHYSASKSLIKKMILRPQTFRGFKFRRAGSEKIKIQLLPPFFCYEGGYNNSCCLQILVH